MSNNKREYSRKKAQGIIKLDELKGSSKNMDSPQAQSGPERTWDMRDRNSNFSGGRIGPLTKWPSEGGAGQLPGDC